MTEITRAEESMEVIYKDNQRAAIFDEKGELYMLSKATKENRSQLFDAKSSN
jgi:hypothetical protein